MSDEITKSAYYDEVRDTAEGIRDELAERVKEGEGGELLREWLLEHIHETMDGHNWVIYTWKAKHVCIYSDNDGAYADNYGPEGMVEDGQIQWSRLAYAAMEQDVMEHLDAIGVDVNDPENSDAFEDLRKEDSDDE